ncbi:LOW QUALITY PROTEIN: uncharacterized protein EMH_0096040 [Eimeria mitis]|uniref:Uncharacterized protein n=1 Tax=Eimeria mitis TaxID=44415 RepID=U6KFH6_9EIME|nr:LOW QUALITY PROTEIN: uncharacterized protein EMH_0096040 [Eimeria mitis]CDJ36785.1 hypothetical protein, conserved [Eimeria mitis]
MGNMEAALDVDEDGTVEPFAKGIDLGSAVGIGGKRLNSRSSSRFIAAIVAIAATIFLIYQCALHIETTKLRNISSRRLSDQPNNCRGTAGGSEDATHLQQRAQEQHGASDSDGRGGATGILGDNLQHLSLLADIDPPPYEASGYRGPDEGIGQVSGPHDRDPPPYGQGDAGEEAGHSHGPAHGPSPPAGAEGGGETSEESGSSQDHPLGPPPPYEPPDPRRFPQGFPHGVPYTHPRTSHRILGDFHRGSRTGSHTHPRKSLHLLTSRETLSPLQEAEMPEMISRDPLRGQYLGFADYSVDRCTTSHGSTTHGYFRQCQIIANTTRRSGVMY